MKNKLIFIIVLSVFSGIVFVGCERKEIKNVDSKGESIICFGDSITSGYGVNFDESYPSILEGMLSLPVINAGLDGDTTSEALKRLKEDVLDKKPFLVIIELGGNDFLRRIPLSETLKNIEEMIVKIQNYGAMVVLVDISAGLIMSEYYKEYKKLSKKYQAIFVPHLLRGILTQRGLKVDFIHPNPEGHRIIAKRIYQVISPFCIHRK
ncbi:MAG: arylesterase [Candidatus Omnitrophica bacterium]|nr:arylesterase [Candidatus Omnitrophota bacterium]MCM8800029.1 arylesterase [Candidatus Omnitrophota bacterium]